MGVYLYSDEWLPGEKTLAYYPLTSTTTVNDLSGNGNTMTNNRTVTFGTNVGVDCAYFSGGSSGSYLSKSGSLWTGNSQYNFSIWFYKTSSLTTDGIFFGIGTGSTNKGNLCYVEAGKFIMGGWDNGVGTNIQCPINGWHHLIQNFDGTTQKLYLDGVLGASNTPTPNIANNITCIGMSANTSSTRPRKGYFSECIFENYAWSAENIGLYYNSTKSKYGIS